MRNSALFALAAVFASNSAWAGEEHAAEVTRHTKVRKPSMVLQPTGYAIAHLADGREAFAVAMELGAKSYSQFKSSSEWITLDMRGANMPELRGNHSIIGFWPLYAVPMQRDAFSPNDPFFPPDAPVAGWQGQWHLKNTVTPGLDLNVEPAWANDVTGSGVKVGVVDDGMQIAHPEFVSNLATAELWDFGQNDNNPTPISSADVHGTAVCGIVGARGGNGVGVTGVAPFAKIAGLRLEFTSPSLLTQMADATLYLSSGSTSTIGIKNHSYGPSIPFAPTASLAAAIEASALVGTINVRSAGNARGSTNEDSNKAPERNTPSALTVAALGSDGVFASYSNFGACIIACTPSSTNNAGGKTILTTDRTSTAGYNGASDSFPDENYTSMFGGTSAAAPNLTGVLTLVKGVQPNLNARFAKHLIARTAVVVDPSDNSQSSDGGWKTNNAGFKFNQNYGFGLIDASAMVTMAQDYQGVTPLQVVNTGTVNVSSSITDGSAVGISRTFTVSSTNPLEEVVVNLNVTHSYRGDLEAYLTSPRGTTSRLFIAAGADSGVNLNWSFTTHAFWGEDPSGTWTLKVVDAFPTDTGTWNSFAATLNTGTLVPNSTTVSGTVDLDDFSADEGKDVDFVLSNGSTTEPHTVTLGAGGSYSFATSLSGNFSLSAKGIHWLRQTQPVNITGATVSGPTYLLKNGDIDRDNSISLGDYLYLAANFDKDSSAGDWLTSDGLGIRPADSDLDGSGMVDLSDYLILAANFDLTGDE